MSPVWAYSSVQPHTVGIVDRLRFSIGLCASLPDAIPLIEAALNSPRDAPNMSRGGVGASADQRTRWDPLVVQDRSAVRLLGRECSGAQADNA